MRRKTEKTTSSSLRLDARKVVVDTDALKQPKNRLREGGGCRGSSVGPAKKSTPDLCFDASDVEEVITAVKDRNDFCLAFARHEGGGRGGRAVEPLGEGHSPMVSERLNG